MKTQMDKVMSLKNIIGKLHLYLGLTSGLLVFIIAVTGCIYAFQAEIQDLTQPYRFVEPQTTEMLPPSALKEVAEGLLPDKHIHGILYSGKDRAAQVIFFAFEPAYYDIIYLNPYTAEVLKVKDVEADFFHIILDGHFYLWLPPEIGQPVAATATLIFVVMLISGIFLWWPRKKKHSKQRFKVKWTARWRRKNYDLHNVLGFYVSAIALLLALTGLVWGFQWFADGVYASAGGDKSLIYTDPYSDTTRTYAGEQPAIDVIYQRMRSEYPDAKAIEVHVPVSPEYAIAANANPEQDTYWKIDYRYYDQYTLEEVSVDHIYGRFPGAELADKMLRMNYDVHTGAILGLPGKILAFLASLIVASLPVTGFVIWYGRSFKKETKRKRSSLPQHIPSPKEGMSLQSQKE
jgi:uncharacterized iron-regulated membrane protein